MSYKDPKAAKAQRKRYYQNNKMLIKKRAVDRNRLVRYGLSPEAYQALKDVQSGRCAICHRTPPFMGLKCDLHVDHDHGTGRIRGLLCNNCNTGLGLFADNPEALRRAASYLE